MKNIFTLLFLLVNISQAFASLSDSIVVNIGNRKRLIIYGESKQDLKDFEKYDLNKIIRQMNLELENMPTDIKRMVIRDFDGTTYNKRTEKQIKQDSLAQLRKEQQYTTKWQHFINTYYLNLSFGLSSVNKTVRDTYINRPDEPYYYTAEPFFYRRASSPMIGISIHRQEVTFRGYRKKVFFKYGLDLSWQFIDQQIKQHTFWATQQNPRIASKIDTLYTFRPRSDNKAYGREDYNNPNSSLPNIYSPTDQSLLYANLELIPTISFYNRNNLQTFSFGLGGYIGTLLTGSNKSYVIRKDKVSQNLNESRFPYITKDNPLRYGVTLVAGYKIFHVFLQTDINNIFRKDDRRWSQNLTTFGLLLGK